MKALNWAFCLFSILLVISLAILGSSDLIISIVLLSRVSVFVSAIYSAKVLPSRVTSEFNASFDKLLTLDNESVALSTWANVSAVSNFADVSLDIFTIPDVADFNEAFWSVVKFFVIPDNSWADTLEIALLSLILSAKDIFSPLPTFAIASEIAVSALGV